MQDNYVVQWGDATQKKALPTGLVKVPQNDYVAPTPISWRERWSKRVDQTLKAIEPELKPEASMDQIASKWTIFRDAYALVIDHQNGWPIAATDESAWPVHCYGMVGVGRDIPPDTGTGAELYTVIGHAPRHLDRNIALVGRVISGIEHLSSLPRGTGALGFYEKPEERTGITSIRLGTEVKDVPRFEYLSTESKSFAAYADARANRRDPFFIVPAGGADICNIPVPVRVVKP